MNIALVASTSAEIEPFIASLADRQRKSNANIDIIISGVGGVMCTFFMLDFLDSHRVDLMIQAGIAGAFQDGDVGLGETVLVSADLFADLGAQEGEAFRDLFDLHLQSPDEFPFTNKALVNTGLSPWGRLGLRQVRSATVNEITTTPERISLIRSKYGADIESMEGAAFHYVCLRKAIPFLQIRTISNLVGERDKSKWKLQEAIGNLNDELYRVFDALKHGGRK